MEKIIPTPTISEILKDEFMKPLNLSAYELAKKISVPTSRIQDLLHNRRKVFGISPKYFLNLQNDIDLRNAEIKNAKEYDSIQPISFEQVSKKLIIKISLV